jgi:hypothetical protein
MIMDLDNNLQTSPAEWQPGEKELSQAEWHYAADLAVDLCEKALWRPGYTYPLDFARSFGLQDETIRHFKLGYCSSGKVFPQWRIIAGMRLDFGLVIPSIVSGVVQYIKVRLLDKIACECSCCKRLLEEPGVCKFCRHENIFRDVRGSYLKSIFNADELQECDRALFCEGEVDCMLAHQQLNSYLPCVALGDPKLRIDLDFWRNYLKPLKTVLLAVSSASEKSTSITALDYLAGDKVRHVWLPHKVKTITEFCQAGGDLLTWIVPELKH